jgi:hypothetical protein
MAGGNGGKHGGDNLQGREGHRRVGETGGKHGGDRLKCAGGLEMMGENQGKHGEDNLQGGEGHKRVRERGGKQGGNNLKCGGNMGGNMGEIICKAGKDIQEWGNWGEAGRR